MSLRSHVSAAALKDATDAQCFLEGVTTDDGPRFREELDAVGGTSYNTRMDSRSAIGSSDTLRWMSSTTT